MTGKGGDLDPSRMTGIRPLGSRRKNQSFFCSFVDMFLCHDQGPGICKARFKFIITMFCWTESNIEDDKKRRMTSYQSKVEKKLIS